MDGGNGLPFLPSIIAQYGSQHINDCNTHTPTSIVSLRQYIAYKELSNFILTTTLTVSLGHAIAQNHTVAPGLAEWGISTPIRLI